MSLIGPRPERPEIVAVLRDQIQSLNRVRERQKIEKKIERWRM